MVGDFLTFRKMITPIIIQLIFWLSVGAVVLVALGMMGNGQTAGGLALLVIGPLAIRIYAELLILIFRIHDVLNEIRDKLIGIDRRS